MPSEIEISAEDIVERFAGAMQVQFEKSARDRPDSVAEERRQQHREEFDATRMIAIWDGEALLDKSDFQPTLCRDLSANGLAFWVNDKPSAKRAVVKFDVNDEVVFLNARIVHIAPEFASGRPAFLVGCEFMGRLDWDLKL